MKREAGGEKLGVLHKSCHMHTLCSKQSSEVGNLGFEQDASGATLIYRDSLMCLPVAVLKVQFLTCIMKIITHAIGRFSRGDIC